MEIGSSRLFGQILPLKTNLLESRGRTDKRANQGKVRTQRSNWKNGTTDSARPKLGPTAMGVQGGDSKRRLQRAPASG